MVFDNICVALVSIMLALAVLVLPSQLSHLTLARRVQTVVGIWALALLGVLWAYDSRTSAAVLLLALFASGLGRIMALYRHMLITAIYPKSERCY